MTTRAVCPDCHGLGREQIPLRRYGSRISATVNGEECRGCGGLGYLLDPVADVQLQRLLDRLAERMAIPEVFLNESPRDTPPGHEECGFRGCREVHKLADLKVYTVRPRIGKAYVAAIGPCCMNMVVMDSGAEEANRGIQDSPDIPPWPVTEPEGARLYAEVLASGHRARVEAKGLGWRLYLIVVGLALYSLFVFSPRIWELGAAGEVVGFLTSAVGLAAAYLLGKWKGEETR